MRVALLVSCFLEYTAELANGVAETDQVSMYILDGLSYLLPDRWRFPNGVYIDKFRRNYSTYFDEPTILKWINPFPWKWDLRFPLSLADAVLNIRRQQPDVLHIQEAVDYRMIVLANCLRRIPLVLTVHDPAMHLGEKDVRSGWEILLRDRLRRRADRIIVHAAALKDELVSHDPKLERKTCVVPMGAHTLFRRWLDPNIPASSEEAPSVLFFGRMYEYKGIDVLVQASSIVLKAVPGVRFVMAGSGPALKRHRQEMDNLGCFEIHDHYIPDEAVSGLFQKASIIVLPYKEASQSAVAAIGVALGKPIVATAVGGIPEFVEDGINGYLVEPNEAYGLAQAMIRLLTDPALRQRMSTRAIHKAETELSWETMARKTLQVYEETIRCRA